MTAEIAEPRQEQATDRLSGPGPVGRHGSAGPSAHSVWTQEPLIVRRRLDQSSTLVAVRSTTGRAEGTSFDRVDEQGRSTLVTSSSGRGSAVVTQYQLAGDYEGYLNFGLSLRESVVFRASEHENPPRLVLDFRATDDEPLAARKPSSRRPALQDSPKM